MLGCLDVLHDPTSQNLRNDKSIFLVSELLLTDQIQVLQLQLQLQLQLLHPWSEINIIRTFINIWDCSLIKHLNILPRASKTCFIEQIEPSTCNPTEIQCTRATHSNRSNLLKWESTLLSYFYTTGITKWNVESHCN